VISISVLWWMLKDCVAVTWSSNLFTCNYNYHRLLAVIMSLLECKTTIFSLNLALKYGWCLMKHWTRLHQSRWLWTRPYRAKPRPALPIHHMRSAFFWDIIQHRMVISYDVSGQPISPTFKGQEIQKREHCMT